MIIIHALKDETWNQYKNKDFYGDESIRKCGFIHCSEVDTYHYVVPNFQDVEEKMVLLVIDTEKIEPEVKWEDLRNCGVEYPHIYGLLNRDAVISVLPHLWDKNRTWIVNDELKQYK